jgi:hypothetical protein
LRVKTGAEGTVAKFDAPDAAVSNLEAELSRDGDKIHFTVPAAGARFDGTLANSGDRITGVWNFPGRPPVQVEFIRLKNEVFAAPRRPQTPMPPLHFCSGDLRHRLRPFVMEVLKHGAGGGG